MELNIPGYHLDDFLGEGRLGQVWSATARKTGARVAVKAVVARSPESASAIRREAALLASLDHPNLISLYEFLELDTASILVMELAEGGSLTTVLANRGRLSPQEVGTFVSDVAAALDHAHSESVLHGDVSVANVLFDGQGRPKLSDLGVARLLGSDSVALGTPAYADPAVVDGDAGTAATDVFALAAVALHALTGSGPWGPPETHIDEVLARAAIGEIDRLPERLLHCPEAMSAALIRALDPVPRNRGTAAEFALDLRASVESRQVVLGAGRLIDSSASSLAERGGSGGQEGGALPQDPAPRHAAPEAARPDFRRPVPAVGASAAVTHFSRPQVRPILAAEPSAGSGGFRGGMVRWVAARPRHLNRRTVIAGMVLIAVTAGLGAVVGIRQLGASSASAAPLAIAATSAATPAGSHPVSSPITVTSRAPAPSERPAGASLTHPAPTADVALTGTLAAIDRHRSLAFAMRRAEDLTEVYASGDLLAQDEKQLGAVVPSGCGLLGVHTTYVGVHVVRQTETEVELLAQTQTTSGELRCGSQVRGRSAEAGPEPMRIVLTRTIHTATESPLNA
ncbi:MAG: Serine/threonine protein kinase [Pseudonocardiales bacterium]|nr:Serine/threonine protein kinase [Pseudonocardiales bacterium]